MCLSHFITHMMPFFRGIRIISEFEAKDGISFVFLELIFDRRKIFDIIAFFFSDASFEAPFSIFERLLWMCAGEILKLGMPKIQARKVPHSNLHPQNFGKPGGIPSFSPTVYC